VAYRIALFAMTLTDLQGHSPIADAFKCDFSRSNCCAAVGRILTQRERRAVPLR